MKNILDKYYAVREQTHSGDMILWSGSYIISKLVQLFSGSKFNHASLVIRIDELFNSPDGKKRRFVMEANSDGIEFKLLSRRLEDYKGHAWWYPLKQEFNLERVFIREWALEQEGIKYDYKSLFKNALGRVSVDAKEYFCSEFCYAAYRERKINMEWPEKKAPRPSDMPKLGIFDEPVQIL